MKHQFLDPAVTVGSQIQIAYIALRRQLHHSPQILDAERLGYLTGGIFAVGAVSRPVDPSLLAGGSPAQDSPVLMIRRTGIGQCKPVRIPAVQDPPVVSLIRLIGLP